MAHADMLLTVADLLDHLGGVSPQRVRLQPAPGTATEQHVLDIEAREDRLCELVDGVLIEKTMGFVESILALAIASRLREFVMPRNLGVVSGEAGYLRLHPGLVRIPDVAYIGWNRFPGGTLPTQAIPDVVPDLAVEVLSPSNTPAEIERKLEDYFQAGCRVVWLVRPASKTVDVHAGPREFRQLAEQQVLDGGELLPGFELPLADLFGELDRRAGASGAFPKQ